MNARMLLLFACAALTAGCKDTLFENPPGDKISACDEHFVGNWRLLPAEPPTNDDALFVMVAPGCKRWRFIDNGKDDVNTENEAHISFAAAAGTPLVVIKDEEKKEYAHHDNKWRNGYMLLRYVFAAGSIELYPVDDKRVAHLIIDGKVKGRTETITQSPGAHNEDEMHNFVAGTSAEMARVAQLDGIFSASRHYTLKPATLAEIFPGGKDPEQP